MGAGRMERSVSARHRLHPKLVIFDLDDTLYDRFGQLDETYRNLPNIKLFPDTLQVLQALRAPKVLISKGDPIIQQKKVDVLGIRPYFKEIRICATPEEKQALFRELMQKYRITEPKDIAVIGDRIDSELRAGKMLGFLTIRLLHGKYKGLKPKDAFEVPDYTIKKLGEVLDIIQ